MAWISRSLTGILKDSGEKEEKEPEFWDDPELFDAGQSVRDDLVELRKSLTESLWGVAAFLAPPPVPREVEGEQNVEHTTGSDAQEVCINKEEAKDGEGEADHREVAEEPAPAAAIAGDKEKLSGMQSDFAELKGGFAKGFSRLSSVIRRDDSESSGKQEKSSQDHGIAGLLKPLIDNVLSLDKPVTPATEDEDASRDGVETPKLGITRASLVDGVSKLASSLFSFDDELDEDDAVQVPGFTDEVIAFARNISLHPETWLDFPLSPDDDQQNRFEMNSHQIDHAYAIERAALRLAALKVEICPRHMSEERFWRIYFVLLHPRLSQEDAALLSTPQILDARKLLLEQLRQSKEEEAEAETITTSIAKSDENLVVDKDAIPSTVKLLVASKSSEETEADEWLHEEATASSITTRENPAAANDEEDVSFSDLEDDHDEGKIQQAAWVELDTKAKGEAEIDDEHAKKHERMGSNDWLTVDKEDA